MTNEDEFERDWAFLEEHFGPAKVVTPKQSAYLHAIKATFTARASDPIAIEFVDRLTSDLAARKLAGSVRRPKQSAIDAMRRCVEAFLYELLKARVEFADWVSCGLRREDFTGREVKLDTFRFVYEEMEAMGLVEVIEGKKFWTKNPFDTTADPLKSGGFTTRFRATEKLVEQLHGDGVRLWMFSKDIASSDADRAFYEASCLVLKDSSKGYGPFKEPGKMMDFTPTEHTGKLVADITALNDFLAEHSLELDGEKQFNGLVRVFNEGDHPRFNWDRGGRLYGSYQSIKRDDRKAMTIDGCGVVEVDVRASFLTTYYALQGHQLDLDVDPYSHPRILRNDIKEFINASLSKGCLLTKWPRGKSKRDDGTKRAPVSEVRRAVLQKHPLLANLGNGKTSGLSWSTLQFHESEAVVHALRGLMARGVVAYPIHDALLVKNDRGDVEQAKGALRGGFYRAMNTRVVVR